jgi:hypothetical protein
VAGDLPAGEKVLEHFAEALGGSAVDDVKSVVADFDFSMPSQSILTSGQEYYQHPDKHYLRIDLAASGVPDYEAGVVGDVAWQSHPMYGAQLLDGEDKRQALRQVDINPFVRWKDFYQKVETVAEELVGERACYKVVLTAAEGAPLTSYFDKESGLLVQEKLRDPTMGVEIVTKLGDYEPIAGVLWPHRIEQEGADTFLIEFTSVRFNVDDIPAGQFDIPESLTKKPEPPEPAPAERQPSEPESE